MKVAADRKTFPDFVDITDALKGIASDLRAADGTIIDGGDVVAFDTDTGRVWRIVVGPRGEPLLCFRHRETGKVYEENGKPFVYSPYGHRPRNEKVLDGNGDWERGLMYSETSYPAPLEIIPHVPSPDELNCRVRIAE